MKRIAWIAGPGIIGSMLFFSIPVSCDSPSVDDFEIQVVLGGNTRERAEISHALWQRHPTPILITGDNELIRKDLLKLGVPESEIIHEPTARNTWENAVFTKPFLEQLGISRAALVTSWFHTSRARACFQSVSPGIHFLTHADPVPDRLSADARKVVAIERLKKLHYWATRSLRPW